MPRKSIGTGRARTDGEASASTTSSLDARVLALVVLAVAIIGRLPALGTWWCLDDWGQLAQAAGYLPEAPGFPARWLSQHVWWSMTWPVLGLNAAAHAWIRILLHAAASLAVFRIAGRAGIALMSQILAAVLFTSSPVAFTPLFWASGIQELLAGVLALWAVERWFAPGRRSLAVSVLAASGSILAKESALGLPLLLAGANLVVPERSPAARRLRWVGVAILLLISAGEALLVAGHFATGSSDPYATGGLMVMIGNLGKFGWWLPTPIHHFTAQVTWSRAVVGLMVFAAWGLAGAMSWRRGNRLPLATWCAALLSLAPVLPLLHQARPYMGYLAAGCAALTLGAWLPAPRRTGLPVVLMLALAATAWSQATMRGRIARADGDGLPADPIVRASIVAGETAREFAAALPPAPAGRGLLVVYQPRINAAAGTGSESGQDMPTSTPRYVALGGSGGSSLLYGGNHTVEWTGSLLLCDPAAYVLCEKVNGFQAWGDLHDALLYAAELFVLAGNYDAAVEHLAHASRTGANRPLLPPAENRIGIPPGALATVRDRFERHLISLAIEKKISGDEFLAYSGFVGAQR